MKKSYLPHLFKLKKYALYGLFLQCFLIGALFASNGDPQKPDIKEVFIDLNVKAERVDHVLNLIEKQTQFSFVYTSKELDTSKRVSINVKNASVSDVLVELSRQAKIKFKQINKNISIQRLDEKEEGLGYIKASFAPVTVTGKVTDASTGIGLPGVTVIVKGTGNGTITDVEGKYAISVDENNVLVFSFVGYVSKEVLVGNQSVINVQLEEDVKSLEEVVVVGYGTQRKSDLTGAVSSISSEAIKEMPTTSIEQVIQGRSAGVQVTQQSGVPGGGLSIKIRGAGSVQGGNEPLYVIDGFPVYSSNDNFNSVYSEQVNALSFLNPNDIASIEILKDASATAIYGSRGANGVVIITTKRGMEGKTNVEFQISQGIQNVSKKIDVLSTTQMEELRRRYEESIGETFTPLPEPYASTNTDWQDLIFQTGLLQDYQLSLSGGTKKTRFMFSGNLVDQEGIVISSGFKRGAIRLNLDHTFNERLSISNNLTASRTYYDGVFTGANGSGDNGSILQSALMLPPFFAPYDEEGGFATYDDFPLYALERMFSRNGLAIAEGVVNDKKFDRFLNNTALNYEIMDGLTLKISGGIDYSNRRNDFHTKSFYAVHSRDSRIEASVGTILSEGWINENTLTYSKSLNDKHNLQVLAGFTQQGETITANSITTYGYPNDALGTNALQLAEEIFLNSNKRKWDMLSYLGRVNYSFDRKYLLTASIRTDGSSKFGANSKWGTFPSVALGWRVIEEDFLKDSRTLSNLKLRASYGITGNQEIGSYRSLRRLASGTVAFDGEIVPSIFLADIPDEGLSWEKTKQANIGMDIGFLQERISLTFDAFQKTTEDLLLDLPQPLTSGISVITRNVGSLQNSGIEVAVTSRNLVGEFQWTTSANFSTLKNEVLDLNGLENYELGPSVVLTEGLPLGAFYGFQTDGLWQLSEGDEAAEFGALPGDVKYVDRNNDGEITPADRTYLGSPFPNTIWGFTNNFSYKGFDLSIFLRGQHGNKVYNRSSNFLENLYTNSYAETFNGWSEDNQDSDFPRPTQALVTRVTDRNIEDASFIRLQNIKLGYRFRVDNVQWIEQAHLFVSGQNLFTRTNYRGYDPEVNSFGQNSNAVFAVDQFSYPKARTFTLGARVNF